MIEPLDFDREGIDIVSSGRQFRRTSVRRHSGPVTSEGGLFTSIHHLENQENLPRMSHSTKIP